MLPNSPKTLLALSKTAYGAQPRTIVANVMKAIRSSTTPGVFVPRTTLLSPNARSLVRISLTVLSVTLGILSIQISKNVFLSLHNLLAMCPVASNATQTITAQNVQPISSSNRLFLANSIARHQSLVRSSTVSFAPHFSLVKSVTKASRWSMESAMLLIVLSFMAQPVLHAMTLCAPHALKELHFLMVSVKQMVLKTCWVVSITKIRLLILVLSVPWDISLLQVNAIVIHAKLTTVTTVLEAKYASYVSQAIIWSMEHALFSKTTVVLKDVPHVPLEKKDNLLFVLLVLTG